MGQDLGQPCWATSSQIPASQVASDDANELRRSLDAALGAFGAAKAGDLPPLQSEAGANPRTGFKDLSYPTVVAQWVRRSGLRGRAMGAGFGRRPEFQIWSAAQVICIQGWCDLT